MPKDTVEWNSIHLARLLLAVECYDTLYRCPEGLVPYLPTLGQYTNPN